jgi:hypothetical protein
MQKQNCGFYYVMNMDDNCRLRNAFWVDTRSRTVYEFFCDVITFEMTYLTNRYDMSFYSFCRSKSPWSVYTFGGMTNIKRGYRHEGLMFLCGCLILGV